MWRFIKASTSFSSSVLMELSTCVLIYGPTSCHLCQLITDLRRCRRYLYFFTFLCLCLCCVCSRFFLYEIPLSLNDLDIQREIFHIKKRVHTHWHTHKSTYWVAAQLKNNILSWLHLDKLDINRIVTKE